MSGIIEAMIEDLQDEYSLYAAPEKKQPTRRGSVFLMMFIIWIILSTIMFFVTRKRISRTLEQTRAVEIVKNLGEYRMLAESEPAVLYFYRNKSGLVPYTVLVKNTGASAAHNAVEGLLAGPTDSVLETGGVSFLSSETRLLGLTISEKTVFLNFSDEIATPEDYETALQQLRLTLRAVNPYIEEIVILINGIDTSN